MGAKQYEKRYLGVPARKTIPGHALHPVQKTADSSDARPRKRSRRTGVQKKARTDRRYGNVSQVRYVESQQQDEKKELKVREPASPPEHDSQHNRRDVIGQVSQLHNQRHYWIVNPIQPDDRVDPQDSLVY